eukprot:659780-Prorocentrum_minimum.AAC.4
MYIPLRPPRVPRSARLGKRRVSVSRLARRRPSDPFGKRRSSLDHSDRKAYSTDEFAYNVIQLNRTYSAYVMSEAHLVGGQLVRLRGVARHLLSEKVLLLAGGLHQLLLCVLAGVVGGAAALHSVRGWGGLALLPAPVVCGSCAFGPSAQGSTGGAST